MGARADKDGNIIGLEVLGTADNVLMLLMKRGTPGSGGGA
jgi:hypothetical protein